jgi:hypothetical protein
MTSDDMPEELREFLLGRVEPEEFDYQKHTAPCYNLAWDKKKQQWIVRVDGKRLMELTQELFPEDVDFRSYEFVDHILRILREDGPEGLKLHIEELQCAR